MIKDAAGVARIGARDHAQRMSADGSNGRDVGREAAGTAGVVGIEHQHAHWLGDVKFFVRFCGRGGGGIGGGQGCHDRPLVCTGDDASAGQGND
ncbi:hypothetical protein D3C85_1642090 [compost metagenome]